MSIKELFRKLLIGTLYGVGFGIGLLVIAYVSTLLPKPESGLATTEKRKSLGMKVVSSKALVGRFGLEIIGTAKNEGEETVSFSRLSVDLFDDAGAFIYQCNDLITDIIEPSHLMNFKVSCQGMPREVFELVETHEVKFAR